MTIFPGQVAVSCSHPRLLHAINPSYKILLYSQFLFWRELPFICNNGFSETSLLVRYFVGADGKELNETVDMDFLVTKLIYSPCSTTFSLSIPCFLGERNLILLFVEASMSRISWSKMLMALRSAILKSRCLHCYLLNLITVYIGPSMLPIKPSKTFTGLFVHIFCGILLR